MDKVQELHGEIRKLLNNTLVFAAHNRNDLVASDFAAAKCVAYREMLDLISKGE